VTRGRGRKKKRGGQGEREPRAQTYGLTPSLTRSFYGDFFEEQRKEGGKERGGGELGRVDVRFESECVFASCHPSVEKLAVKEGGEEERGNGGRKRKRAAGQGP